MKILLFLCCANFITSALSSLSGLYIDNGIDQTVIQRVMTLQEKQEVQHEILNLLGLPDRPNPKKVLARRAVRKSAPKFLLNVYKSLQDSPSPRKIRSEFNLSDRDLQSIDESDMIISFTGHYQPLSDESNLKGNHLTFDISGVSVSETIVGAELRLYHSSNFNVSKSRYTVSVYTTTDNLKNGKVLELIDTANTTSDYEGWIIFNVTGLLATWIVSPQSNEGVLISVKSLDSGDDLHPETAGLILEDGDEERQPFMVGFLQGVVTRRGGGGEVGSESRRVRRQAGGPRHRKKKADPQSDYPTNPFTDSGAAWSHSQKSCQIQTLYVSFRDLKWQDWIIAPDGYGAYYCSGECNFPLNAHMNATNHAIVQTLVHLMNPLQVPKPCCAPTKLTPISVLYFLDESNVILKKYKNMVVKSCGCH